MTYPLMALVKQKLINDKIENISLEVQNALASLKGKICPNQKVAICVGSRGINRLNQIVKSCVDSIKEKQAIPVIIPSMGSHGGGTSEGQFDVLATMGIDSANTNAQIDADLNVELLGHLKSGVPIFFSCKAVEADHILVINRIKPHTKFNAPIESGLCKMLVIGLGKVIGARTFHQYAVTCSFGIIEEAAMFILNRFPEKIHGLAILEDGYRQTCRIVPVDAGNMIEQEKILLKDAYKLMPKIPFDNLDILIVDKIGKDISGIGMDSNVTGRHRDITGDFSIAPHIKRIFVRDLSANSKGNGNGIGLADFTTSRCVKAIDWKKTYVNALTAISPEKAAIPMYFDKDSECIDACLKTIGPIDLQNTRIVHIQNTSTLDRFMISMPLKTEMESNPNITQINQFEPMRFDEFGNLVGVEAYNS